MYRERKNIIILEPSQIIFEGLSTILSKSNSYYKFYRAENLNELESLIKSEKIDIAIINPSQIQNKVKEFYNLKKDNPCIYCIALIYSLFDNHLLSLFDKEISIFNSALGINKVIDEIGNATQEINSSENEQLTEREIDVLKLLVKGLSNKEIGDTLNISIHTVISHRKNITQKTGIKSQSGLTIYAISNKIVLLEDYTNQ